jgi:hypothetical protein
MNLKKVSESKTVNIFINIRSLLPNAEAVIDPWDPQNS